ncbi:hypothetical protein B0H19DRAFT_1043555 [Mycena capillaripes]|nr:hypothetical protein B0H19DRAFT_1043555 [Mycena capillaripes]
MPPPQSFRKSASRSYCTETPYKDHLHTNFVPSDEECRRILDVVASFKEEAQEITDEISRLQDSLEEMGRKRDHLQSSIVSHLALVSGARRLPHDILGEIFIACLPQASYSSMRSTEAPLLLSHICSEWRRSAISMPRLWASLGIAPRYAKVDATNKKSTAWLTRSRNLPISISISSSPSSHSVLQPFLECSHRLEHVRFFIPLAHLEPLSSNHVPMLTSAVIDVGVEARADNSKSLSFIRAPSVRALSLRRFFPGLQGFISSAGLSSLALQPISLGQALTALGQCPNLETCALKNLLDDKLSASNLIHLKRLERLSVIDDNQSTTRLFHHITLPNVRTLEYSHRIDSLDSLPASFCTPDKLEELSLSTPLSTDALAELLRNFSMLQKLLLHRPTLSFRNGIAPCKLFTLLAPRPNAETLCPHLESICSLGLDVGSDKELLTMIDARRRMNGIQSLSVVHIAFIRDRKTKIARKEGLTTDLRYPDNDQLRFIKGATGQNKTSVPAPKTPQVEMWRRDVDVDWAPISGEWLAEYDEWGGLRTKKRRA